MRRALVGVIVLLGVLGPTVASGDEGRLLRAIYSKGERFTFVLNETSEETLTRYGPQQVTETTREEKEVGASWEVLDVTPGGDAHIAARFDYFELKLFKNDKLVAAADSRDPQRPEALNQVIAIMRIPFKFTVSSRGKVIAVTGLDQMLEKWRSEAEKTMSPQQRAEQDWLVEGLLGQDNVAKTLSEIFTPLPPAPLEPGRTWDEPLDLRLEFQTLKGVRTYRVAPHPALSGWYLISESTKFVVTSNQKAMEFETLKGTITSSSIIHAKSGRLVRKTSRFDIDVNVYETGADGRRALVSRTTAIPVATVTIRPALTPEARRHFDEGIALAWRKQFDVAVREFNQAIALQPGAAELFSNRGSARRDGGDPRGALSDFDRAIQLDPWLDIAYFGRAAARAAIKDYAGAIEDHSMVIELTPAFWKSYFLRGLLQSLLGRWDAAIADFTGAIARNPEFADLYRFRADAYARQGNRGAAEADLQKWRQLGGRE